LSHCALETGAVIRYESFEGVEGLKDRYFIVLVNSTPEIECFTTTTQPHAERNPRLASEFCEIHKDECCLPRRCFVDFREVYRFDDISIGSRLRSGRIKHLGDLPDGVLQKIHDGFIACRSQSQVVKDRILKAINCELDDEGD
jgi:hypothetical protein